MVFRTTTPWTRLLPSTQDRPDYAGLATFLPCFGCDETERRASRLLVRQQNREGVRGRSSVCCGALRRGTRPAMSNSPEPDDTPARAKPRTPKKKKKPVGVGAYLTPSPRCFLAGLAKTNWPPCSAAESAWGGRPPGLGFFSRPRGAARLDLAPALVACCWGRWWPPCCRPQRLERFPDC